MKSAWEIMLGCLAKMCIGMLIAVLHWVPFYYYIRVSVVPWMIGGLVVGVFLIFAWENRNPFSLRRASER